MNRRREALTAYLFLFPFLALFAAFILQPIIRGVWLSFFQWDGQGAPVWHGVGNYVSLWHSRSFWIAFTNLGHYVIITVPLGVSVALGLAVLVNSFRGVSGNIFRSAYFVPVMLPLFLAATIWRWMYAPNFGLLNMGLEALGFQPVAFLNNTGTMLYSLIAVDVWVSAGFNMVILLAALKNVPEEMHEAAKLDGAGPLARLIFISIPQIAPVLLFVVAYSLITALQVFDAPWLLTGSSFMEYGGRGNALLFPVMDMMGRAFSSIHFGLAAAYGTILALVILAVTAIVFGLNQLFRR